MSACQMIVFRLPMYALNIIFSFQYNVMATLSTPLVNKYNIWIKKINN